MEKVAEFKIQVNRGDNNQFVLVLACDGDDFETEVTDVGDLVDEVDEYLLERLQALGVTTPES